MQKNRNPREELVGDSCKAEPEDQRLGEEVKKRNLEEGNEIDLPDDRH